MSNPLTLWRPCGSLKGCVIKLILLLLNLYGGGNIPIGVNHKIVSQPKWNAESLRTLRFGCSLLHVFIQLRVDINGGLLFLWFWKSNLTIELEVDMETWNSPKLDTLHLVINARKPSNRYLFGYRHILLVKDVDLVMRFCFNTKFP